MESIYDILNDNGVEEECHEKIIEFIKNKARNWDKKDNYNEDNFVQDLAEIYPEKFQDTANNIGHANVQYLLESLAFSIKEYEYRFLLIQLYRLASKNQYRNLYTDVERGAEVYPSER